MSPANPKDPWAHRLRFRGFVDLWMENNPGKTRADLASAMGIAVESLKQYYSGKHIPGRDLLLRMASVLGCSIADLVDDPGGAPTGLDPAKWAELTEKKRVLASAMLEDLLAIPEGEEDVYYALWKQGQAIGRSRREQEAKTGGGSAPKK